MPVPDGTYQQALDRANHVRQQEPPKPFAPVTALGVTIFSRIEEKVYAPRGSRVALPPGKVQGELTIPPPEGPCRTGAQYVARAQAKGVDLIISPDGSAMIARRRDGRRDKVDEVYLAAPILLPFLRDGREPDCFDGCGRQADDVALAWPVDLPWNHECNGSGKKAKR